MGPREPRENILYSKKKVSLDQVIFFLNSSHFCMLFQSTHNKIVWTRLFFRDSRTHISSSCLPPPLGREREKEREASPSLRSGFWVRREGEEPDDNVNKALSCASLPRYRRKERERGMRLIFLPRMRCGGIWPWLVVFWGWDLLAILPNWWSRQHCTYPNPDIQDFFCKRRHFLIKVHRGRIQALPIK